LKTIFPLESADYLILLRGNDFTEVASNIEK